ncbi:XLF-domain-containing protein [Hypoxylon crocopeplum]|nr:XLF-domain-containing protein [Hypoxylon crocopeplum]
MASASKWHPLPAFPDLPALMISPQFASASYTLHVTDLASVWVENLDRRGILLRSLQEITSIDLSDSDPNQWAVFLSKLNAAFDPTSPDHHSTSLSISAASSDGTTEGGLVLHVTCVLPKPLKPLKWPVYLTKCPPVGLASELVLPLIQAQHVRSLEIGDLVARLKEKDAVITKLVDKLEALGTGLENVFNSLSTKRKPSRAVAEDKVKGLAVFNESDWRSTSVANAELPQDVSSLIHEVFAESGLQRDVDSEISASSLLNDWWTKIGSSPKAAVKPQVETLKKPQDTRPRDTETAGERDDDDFQVQATPPNLQSHTRTLGHSKAADDTADDDGPEEIPDSHPAPSQVKSRSRIGGLGGKKADKDTPASQSSRTIPADEDETTSESDTEPVQLRSQKRPNSRLGNINKSKNSSPPRPKSSPPAPPPPKNDNDETASDSDSDSEDDNGKPSKAGSSSPPPATTQQMKTGLGRIGGKSKSKAIPELPEESKVIAPEVERPKDVASPVKPSGRKLGTIGKKLGTDGKRQRSESPAEPETTEHETEEQRTERKRIELAKELERKATAPTKKKRRF